jgi:hypothetical protein
MTQARDPRGRFCGAIRATQATNTLAGRGGGRGGSTSPSEKKPIVEEVTSNIEKNSAA